MNKIIYYMLLFCSITFAQQWKFLGLSTESVTSIAVDWANPNIIYAGSFSNYSSGTIGGIFKSTNGGISWDTLMRGVTVNRIVINPKYPNILFVTLAINGSTTPSIIKTTDGGNSWQEADSGIFITGDVGPDPLAIDPEHPDTMYCGTGGFYGGKFYRSTNGGNTWETFGDSTALIDGVSSIAIDPDSTNVVFAGTAWNGDILKSTDYGGHWNETEFKGGIIYSIQFGSNSSIIFAGSSWTGNFPAGIFKSIDGGKTWSNPKTGLPDSVTVGSIQIDTNGSVYIVANWRDSGGVYRSSDNGAWIKVGIGSGRVGTIELTGATLYASYGGIYKMEIPTSVTNDRWIIPEGFYLYNNFPNPFNPTTIINYQIPKSNFVTLKVYDILGNIVKTLVDGYRAQGRYSVSFNASNLASGIYFYRLGAGNFVSTKKMLLLK